MNEKIFTSTKLVQPVQTGDYWQFMCYSSTWDAFMAISIFDWGKVFRDGTKIKFGQPSGSYSMLGRVKGFSAYYSQWTLKVYPAFEINCLPNPNEVLNPNWDIGYSLGPSSLTGKFIDDINQVYLNQPSANRIDIYNLENGQKVGEIVHNAGEYFTSLAWVQTGQVVGMCKTSGKVVKMDYLSSEPRVIATGRVDSFRVGAYDCAFNLFVTIGTDNKVRVYCGDLWPNSLSNPIFEPTVVSGLNANKVTVRLLGQDGEPMKGWWVNWELVDLGSGIIGRLDKYGSNTNAEGYAHNLYIGPNDNTIGPCKVEARVEV